MSTTWYGNQTSVSTVVLGKLALVAPMLERMRFTEIVDRYLPADPQLVYSYGTTLAVLVAARACQPTALSNIARWAQESGAEHFLHMPADQMNDDRLGRALDHFFDARHSITAEISLHVAQEFGIELKSLHIDPTHVLFTGVMTTPKRATPPSNSMREATSPRRALMTISSPRTS